MSRYSVDAREPARYAVVVGWDKPLQTFFAQVTEKAVDRDWDMKLWIGTNPREVNSVEELREKLKPFADIPQAMHNTLAYDQGPMERTVTPDRGEDLER